MGQGFPADIFLNDELRKKISNRGKALRFDIGIWFGLYGRVRMAPGNSLIPLPRPYSANSGLRPDFEKAPVG